MLFRSVYKHMGTEFSLTHDLSQEVSTRAAVIRSGTRAIKSVLQSPGFPLVKKLSFVKAHLFSSGFFQCSTWGPLSPSLYGKIHSSVIQVYRVATRNLFNPSVVNFMFSDADLICEYGLVSPMSIIRYSRISLFARVAGKSPSCLVDLLKAVWDGDFGWVCALRRDRKSVV